MARGATLSVAAMTVPSRSMSRLSRERGDVGFGGLVKVMNAPMQWMGHQKGLPQSIMEYTHRSHINKGYDGRGTLVASSWIVSKELVWPLGQIIYDLGLALAD